MVDDLVDISKIDAIKLELHKTTIDIRQLLESVMRQYEKYCETQGIDLSLDCKAEGSFEADEGRIRQVLYNFINNSLNYNSKKEQKIIIGSEKLEDGIRIFVYDNGDGIDKQDLNNIWDRYYKVDKEHKRHHIGSGIGLSLAKQLIEAHGMECGGGLLFRQQQDKGVRTGIGAVMQDAGGHLPVRDAADHQVFRLQILISPPARRNEEFLFRKPGADVAPGALDQPVFTEHFSGLYYL